jgi:uncharacterized protein
VTVAILVLAKSPRPGWSKTRLCPPCTPEQAAHLAEAALRDSLEAVAAAPGTRRVLVLDGEPGPWLPRGFEVLPQRSGGLDARLAGAFEDAGGPAVLVGMDTPQVTPADLAVAVARLRTPGVSAVLGPAEDGGYWAVGLQEPDPRVFLGVPMSTPWTASRQRARLRELGTAFVELPPLRDVDVIDDAWAIASAAPTTRFAAVLREMFDHRPVGAAR